MMVVKRRKKKAHKKGPRKRKHKFEGYKHCLQATQLDKSKNIKKTTRKKLDVDSLKENHK